MMTSHRTSVTCPLSKMYYSIILLSFLVGLQSFCQCTVSPTYNTEQTICDSDDDCDSEKMEVCWRLYSGCYHGVCMCNPITHLLHEDSGKCKIFRYGNEECTNDDMCLDSMTCVNGTCQCLIGEMTPEGNFCMMSHHRLLGQRCNPSTDICLQNTASGYIESDVWCTPRGRCSCTRGLQQHGLTCIKPPVTKCTRSYQCEGGFICLNGECSCPHNYWPVAHDTKCAKENAIVDLPLGAHCDEINERKYCAAGLICHRCYNEKYYKCVKYSLSETSDSDYLTTSSAVRCHCSRFSIWRINLILLVLATIFGENVR